MPYIDVDARDEAYAHPCNTGELNYCISIAVSDYIMRMGLSYKTLNEAIGVLECAKLELYRRIAAPYEDKKLALNGDVYDRAIRT